MGKDAETIKSCMTDASKIRKLYTKANFIEKQLLRIRYWKKVRKAEKMFFREVLKNRSTTKLSEVIRCTHCQNEIEKEDNYCTWCGKPNQTKPF